MIRFMIYDLRFMNKYESRLNLAPHMQHSFVNYEYAGKTILNYQNL
jgi:hypothetical protein